MAFGERRQELRHHIRGDGIEIGALHLPFDLSDLPVTRVRYVDRMPVEQLRLQYPELNNEHFVDVDLIDDGQVLGTIPDESLDFIIANHMIEHCDNPLGALETWLSKLRQGGIVFMAVPDQRKGWDERREVTSLEHILQDYRSTAVERKARNYEHFKSWTELVGNIHDEAHVRRLIDIDYSIHFHVFTFESFRSLLNYASREMRLPFRVVDAVEPSDSSWESVFVLQKTHFTGHVRGGFAWPALKHYRLREASSGKWTKLGRTENVIPTVLLKNLSPPGSTAILSHLYLWRGAP